MKFEYTGRHVDVTPALRRHVEEHFSKIDAIFNDTTAAAHVIIEVEKNRHKGRRVLDENEALQAVYAMENVVCCGTGSAANDGMTYEVFGKTGPSRTVRRFHWFGTSDLDAP